MSVLFVLMFILCVLSGSYCSMSRVRAGAVPSAHAGLAEERASAVI